MALNGQRSPPNNTSVIKGAAIKDQKRNSTVQALAWCGGATLKVFYTKFCLTALVLNNICYVHRYICMYVHTCAGSRLAIIFHEATFDDLGDSDSNNDVQTVVVRKRPAGTSLQSFHWSVFGYVRMYIRT